MKIYKVLYANGAYIRKEYDITHNRANIIEVGDDIDGFRCEDVFYSKKSDSLYLEFYEEKHSIEHYVKDGFEIKFFEDL